MLIIDEPELFLHPSLISKLANNIKKLRKKETTIILTTHSPSLLSHLIHEDGMNLVITQKNEITGTLKEPLYFNDLKEDIKAEVITE